MNVELRDGAMCVRAYRLDERRKLEALFGGPGEECVGAVRWVGGQEAGLFVIVPAAPDHVRPLEIREEFVLEQLERPMRMDEWWQRVGFVGMPEPKFRQIVKLLRRRGLVGLTITRYFRVEAAAR